MVVITTSLPKVIPPDAALKFKPAAVPVVMLPLSVVNPEVVTDRVLTLVVVPTAPSVTAPDPAVIVNPCVFAARAFTALDPKFTTPFPVVVVMTTSPRNVIPPDAALKFTPAAVPVVMLPLSDVSPEVVTLNDLRAVVVPTAPSVTAPDPAVIVKLCILAILPLIGVVPKLTMPFPIDVSIRMSTLNMIDDGRRFTPTIRAPPPVTVSAPLRTKVPLKSMFVAVVLVIAPMDNFPIPELDT